jgi:DNA-binding NtrC family response regulator
MSAIAALQFSGAGSNGRGEAPRAPVAPHKPGRTERVPTILVVEDEILIRLAVADFLRDSDYRVLEAANAVEAQKVLASGEAIDLVFSDITMPGALDGLGLAAWIRRELPEVQVILTSGVVSVVHAARQAAGFVEKPYSYESLAAQIKRVIGR